MNTQATSAGASSACPVISVNAGIGATRPPDTMDAAAEAVVWPMLLSWAVHSRRPKARASGRQSATPISSAMIDMLKDQPIFSPE